MKKIQRIFLFFLSLSLASCAGHIAYLSDFPHPKNLKKGEMSAHVFAGPNFFEKASFGGGAALGLSEYLSVRAFAQFDTSSLTSLPQRTTDFVNLIYLGPAIKIYGNRVDFFRANWELGVTYHFNKTLGAGGFITGPSLGLYTKNDVFFVFLNTKVDAMVGAFQFDSENYRFGSVAIVPGIGLGFTIIKRMEIKAGLNVPFQIYENQDRRKDIDPLAFHEWGGTSLVGLHYVPFTFGLQLACYLF